MVLRPQAFKKLSNGAKSGLLALFKRSTMSCVSVLSKLAVASLCLSPAGRVPHLRLFPWARRNRNAAWKKSIGFLNVNKLTVHHFCQAAFGKERGTDTDPDEALVHADRPGKKDILDSGLYLVATPIGNLEDITLRALHVLRSANLILSEDTRHSGKLLQYHNIRTPLMSYHKFNESSRQATILQRLGQGQIVAVISDAGTPGICDPGAKIAKVCIDEKFRVIPIPGPCAVISALAASGLPTAEFSFVGFLPIHNNTRKKRLMAAANEAATQIFYVPPHRLHQFLEESISIFGQSRCCVIAREMTKLHEEFWRGTLAEAKSEFSQRNPRGEITFLIQGQENHHADAPSETELERELQYLMSNGQSTSEAVKSVSERMSIKRKLVYALALKMHGSRCKLESRVQDEDGMHMSD